MRIEVTPRQADITPGQPLPVTITITNTSTVIGGYLVRMLGVDPGWVEVDTDQISLFPDESRTLVAMVTAPRGIPAGQRRIAIQVRELTPPEGSVVTEVDLTVPAAESAQMRVDPLAVTAGRRASFSVLVENTGNTVFSGYLGGDDAEGKVRFTFSPGSLSLAPGEHALVDMRASARRHIVGSPTVRSLNLYLDRPTPDAFFGPETEATRAARDEQGALAHATFMQKALLSRGPLSLLGLLAAVTVFAIVLTVGLSRIVGQSTADRDLALQVAGARNGGGSGGTSGISGTVRLLTSGAGVPAASVSVFAATDTNTAVATTATDNKGAYSFADLAAGKYKISYRGAGFVQLWYPGTATDADATVLTLRPGQVLAGRDVTLGGIPSTINGKVVGDDVSNATLFLETATTGGTSANGHRATPLTNTPAAPTGGGAVVQTVPIGADGTFSLVGVPSPSIYDLVVTKTGYATSTQRIDIGAGETRNGVQITLSRGDGLISGSVTSSGGALGGVTITATAGQSTANTVSLTGDRQGTFTLRSLPTPATFTIVASEGGFASQTLTLTLAAGQKLTGVAITLSASSGALGGRVLLADNTGAAGVSVTVTDGQLTAQTVTEGAGTVGSWHVGGLPVPGTYTVTFARTDLSSQTISVSLDPGGAITPGSQSLRVDAAGGVDVTMQSNTQDVYGFVTQSGATGCNTHTHGLGEATVTLNSGASTYTTTSAGATAASCGEYYFGQVPPGTYTLTADAGSGTSPSSHVITVVAGGAPQRIDIPLPAPASVTGRLVSTDDTGTDMCGWTVNLYLQAQYPTVTTASTTTCTAGQTGGRFLIADIPAGTYVIEVRQTPGSTPAASKQVFVQPSTRTDAGTIKVSPNG